MAGKGGPSGPPSLFGLAIRLGERLSWVCVPVLRNGDGDWVPPGKYKDLFDQRPTYDLALLESLWGEEYEDDEDIGIAALWPQDIVVAEADSPEGEAWLAGKKLPRTPAHSSRRGPHYLFRGNGEGIEPHPLGEGGDVEVLSVHSGKRLLVLPPTAGKEWWPSQSPFDTEFAPLPKALARKKKANNHRVIPEVVEEGVREETMVSVAGTLRAKGFTPAEIRVALGEMNKRCDPPLSDSDLDRIANSSAQWARGNDGNADHYFSKKDGFIPARLGAEIKIAFRIRVGTDNRLWRYENGVYLSDGEKIVREYARAHLGDKFKRRHADETIYWLASELPSLPESPDPNILNVANGLLDWRTGELRPHDPEFPSYVQLPVVWDPNAKCPRFKKFLREVLPRDALKVALEIIGYCILLDQRHRRAVLLLGPGSNGKSVFLRVLEALLGSHNVTHKTLQSIGENRFAAADVYGKLANIAGDLDARALKRTDLFKTLTGGDRISAERKFHDPFEFLSFATLVFSANEAPMSADQTNAYFDRWIILPFEVVFDESNTGVGLPADPQLLEKLTTPDELSGILNRAVWGLKRLTERGRFRLPASVKAANQQYRERLDSVRAFVEERCDVSPDAQTRKSRLYEKYREWCVKNGRFAVSAQQFASRLRALVPVLDEGYSRGGTGRRLARVWKGIGPIRPTL
jgi:putative DNA primase/helicase